MGRWCVVAFVLVLGCSGAATTPSATVRPDAARSGPFSPALRAELDEIFSDPQLLTKGDIDRVGASDDVRAAWVLVDLLRFHQSLVKARPLEEALAELTGVTYRAGGDVVPWVGYTNLLMRAHVPAPPGYFRWKRSVYVAFHEPWKPFFDQHAAVDWRHVSWGGVLRDSIVALNDPPVVAASKGNWLPDDDVVFGIVVGGEARAYPRRVMEVHELVNDTVGGRRIGLPYCTLCGSAIPYFTDRVAGTEEPLELRTSGLLQRSNKLMYDAQTESLFDQFSGRAVTGPLLRRKVKLPRFGIVITTWGRWKRAHPDTTITPKEIDGRAYGPDPLGDRDRLGPVFPVGEIDQRLGAQEVVFGVRTPTGRSIAFPVAAARRALREGRHVVVDGVSIALEAGGLRASFDGRGLVGHEAYWFAWSQFHPGTLMWRP